MYSLLYEEVDEGGVEIVRILGFPCTQADLRPDVEEFRGISRNFKPPSKKLRENK